MAYDMAGNWIDERGPTETPLVEAPQAPQVGALVAPEPYIPQYDKSDRMNPRRQMWAGLLMDMGQMFGGWNGSNYGGRSMSGLGARMANDARNYNNRLAMVDQQGHEQYRQAQNQHVMNQAKLNQMGVTNPQKDFKWINANRQSRGEAPLTPKEYFEMIKAPGVSIQVGGGGNGMAGTNMITQEQKRQLGLEDSDMEYQLNDKGQLSAVPGTARTDAARKVEGYYNTALRAENVLANVVGEGYDPATKSPESWVADMLPGRAGNFVRSDREARYNAARDRWVDQVLRDESGAALGKEEKAEKIKIMFPGVNASPQAQEEGRRARHQALENLRNRAGLTEETPYLWDKPPSPEKEEQAHISERDKKLYELGFKRVAP